MGNPGRRALIATLAALVLAGGAAPARAEDSKKKKKFVSCSLTYSLKGWSAIYKTARGEGRVTCDNGESAEVSIRVKGGGLTFGKSEIVEGSGSFTGVKDLSEVFGSYAAGSAHASAVRGGEAAVYTKGEVSLALAGSGRGIDVGIDFGKLTIKRKGS
jgi:hypothetical protein